MWYHEASTKGGYGIFGSAAGGRGGCSSSSQALPPFLQASVSHPRTKEWALIVLPSVLSSMLWPSLWMLLKRKPSQMAAGKQTNFFLFATIMTEQSLSRIHGNGKALWNEELNIFHNQMESEIVSSGFMAFIANGARIDTVCCIYPEMQVHF